MITIPADSFVFEWADTWLAAIGRASWQGGIALGLVWVACRCFPRLPPRCRCWLWRLALLKLLLAAVLPATMDLPILPSRWAGAFGGISENPPATASLSELAPGGSVTPRLPGDHETTLAVAPDAGEPSGLAASAGAVAPARSLWPPVLLLTWLAVVVGLAGLVAGRILGARRWRRRCVLIKDPEILSIGEQLARRLRLVQPPLLFEADFCRAPVVFGAVRTAIVLPASLVAGTSTAQMRSILAHEMAHIRRGDLLGNWFSTVVSALFFFHPLAWLAFRETRLAQEMACDELAVRQADVSVVDYGRLIVDLATRYRQRSSVVVAVGVVESFHHSLGRRLTAMKRFGTGSWRVLVVSWLLAGVAVLGLLPWRVVAQNAPDAGQKAPEAKRQERTVLAQTKSGPYTIVVERARRDRGSRVELAPSVFPMMDMKTFHETKTETFAGGSAGGSAAGMSGGSASAFTKPNLVLDVAVEGPKLRGKTQRLCAVAGKLRGLDDQGQPVESPDLTPHLRLRLSGIEYREGDGRTAIHLYLPPASQKAKYLQSLEGDLLVAEGTVSHVTFRRAELAKPTTKRSNQMAVRVSEFRQTPEGIDVALAASPPESLRKASNPAEMMQNPLEHMQAMMSAQGRLAVTLEDSQGGTHSATGSKSATGGSGSVTSGGGGGGSWSTEGGTHAAQSSEGQGTTESRRFGFARGGGSSSGSGGGGMWSSTGASGKDGDWPTQEFHFDPLPAGADVKSLTCTVTDRTGKPEVVHFRLENIELPE